MLSDDARRVVAAMVQGFPDVGGTVHDAVEARAVLDRAPAQPPTVPMRSVRDEVVPGAAGSWADAALRGRAEPAEVAVRVYEPDGAVAGGPVVVFAHGGGWVLGDLDRTDATCRRLSRALGAVLVSVDYRLAPEHPFPAGLRDVCAALSWAVSGAGVPGAELGRLVVAGDSSGANLAAAAALAARGGAGPALALQVLIEPVLDAACDSGSYQDPAPGGFLTPAHLRWFWGQYLAHPGDGDDPLASPSRAPDLTGLAPALVVATGHDPLRDEAAAYATRLVEAGVPVGHRCFDDLFHGAPGLADALPEAAAAVEEVVGRVRAALATTPADPTDQPAPPAGAARQPGGQR